MEMQERPPYVRFEVRAEEDRTASIEAGHYVAKNVAYALITPAGSKDCVEKVAEDWLAQIARQSRDGGYPPQWVEHFKAAFKQWQEDNTIPESGTPIKGWQLLSPAQQQQILSANVRTVEDLAVLNEAGLARIGMGARDLQQKAKAWLEEGQSKGSVAAKNAAMQVELDALKERLTALETENARLREKGDKRRRPEPQANDFEVG